MFHYIKSENGKITVVLKIHFILIFINLFKLTWWSKRDNVFRPWIPNWHIL